MFTSANSSFASPSCRAGWPPTSTQLLMISRSSSSLGSGHPFSPSCSNSSKERAGGSNLIRRPRQMMPIKIGSKKKKIKLLYFFWATCIAVPQLLPLWLFLLLLQLAHNQIQTCLLHGMQNILLKANGKKTAVNVKKIREMEPLSILWEMACYGAKVPDDHVTARKHTPSFRSQKTCFFEGQIFSKKGASFSWS